MNETVDDDDVQEAPAQLDVETDASTPGLIPRRLTPMGIRACVA